MSVTLTLQEYNRLKEIERSLEDKEKEIDNKIKELHDLKKKKTLIFKEYKFSGYNSKEYSIYSNDEGLIRMQGEKETYKQIYIHTLTLYDNLKQDYKTRGNIMLIMTLSLVFSILVNLTSIFK